LTRLVLTGVAGSIDSYEYVIPDVFGVGAVIMALAIFAMARRGVLSSRRLLDPAAAASEPYDATTTV
jgi:hypothetical protein